MDKAFHQSKMQRLTMALAFALAACCLLVMTAQPAWATGGETKPESARAVQAMTPDETLAQSFEASVSEEAAVIEGVTDESMGLLADNAVGVGVIGNAYQSEGRKLLALVNAARSRVGVPMLNWDSALEETAIQRAAELMLYFDHTRPDGSSCFTAFPSCYVAGENIAAGYRSTSSVNDGWTNSAGHYANMINRSFTSMAAACVQGYDGTLYWVEVFSDRPGTGFVGDAVEGTYSFLMMTDHARLSLSFSNRTVTPGYGTYMRIPSGKNLIDGDVFTYVSSNERVAGVSTASDTFGMLEGRSLGRATLTAYFYQTTRRAGSFNVTVQFADAPLNDWYVTEGWLAYVLEHDLMGGYSGTPNFGPGDTLTRGQVATILYRAVTGDKDPDNNVDAGFSDVPRGQYYAAPVRWAARAGIVTGYSGTDRFGPNDPVTREQLATMLGRYAAWVTSNGTTTDALPASQTAFDRLSDSGSSSEFAVPYLIWSVDNGIMGAAGTLMPQNPASRAEMAKMITVVQRDILKMD